MKGYTTCPQCGKIIRAYNKINFCCEYCDVCYDSNFNKMDKSVETEKLVSYTRKLNDALAIRQVFL